MRLKIVAIVESREEYEDIVVAYNGCDDVKIFHQGYEAVIEADTDFNRLIELTKKMPPHIERIVHLD